MFAFRRSVDIEDTRMGQFCVLPVSVRDICNVVDLR
jgi:hypothetical protein